MPVKLDQERGGTILVVHVSGMLAKTDYEFFVPEFERLIRQQGTSSLLLDMTELRGWEVGAAWEDFKFGVDHFTDIKRLAMIGETKWQQGMAIFCKPFTNATVRYFDRPRAAEAREWLEETA